MTRCNNLAPSYSFIKLRVLNCGKGQCPNSYQSFGGFRWAIKNMNDEQKAEKKFYEFCEEFGLLHKPKSKNEKRRKKAKKA